MRFFFLAIVIATVAFVYYNDEIKYQLMLWSGGSRSSTYYSGSPVTNGMASFGSSLGSGYQKMGEGIAGN
jgi:hypothetical protein